VDTHLLPGTEISPYYDSLLAKVITYGATREEVRRRMESALSEFSLLGVRTTAAFLREVIASETFARGELSTHFVPEFLAQWNNNNAHLKLALIAAASAAQTGLGAASVATPHDGNRSAARPQRSPWFELGEFELWRHQSK
jgi:acetyl/propionyl-CoA carboxylase alpha subunit